MADLITCCTTQDAAARPTAQQLLGKLGVLCAAGGSMSGAMPPSSLHEEQQHPEWREQQGREQEGGQQRQHHIKGVTIDVLYDIDPSPFA